MGRRGPKPTPTATLKLRGSHRAKDRRADPKPRPGAPERPDWLDGYARAMWDELCPMLDSMGVLADADGMALALLCTTWARWRRCEEWIAEHGATYTPAGAGGKPGRLVRQRPEAQLANELVRLVGQQFAWFGLTPASRTRINTADRPVHHDPAKAAYLRIGAYPDGPA